MSAKRLAALIAPVLILVSSTLAQGANELSITGGRIFVSTQTVPATGDQIHFGNPASFAFNYSRLIKTYKIFGLSGEVPVAIFPHMDLNYPVNVIPKDIGGLFVTPSVRLSAFSGEAVSPWISVGGGYGRFWESQTLLFGGTNPGSTGSNTGVLQIGAGLDVYPWKHWGARFEARDFYSGAPALNVDTGSREHNYYVGGGVIYRF